MHHQCTQNGRVSLSVIMKTLTLLTKIRRSMPLFLWKQKGRAREGKGRSVPTQDNFRRLPGVTRIARQTAGQ
jgi:hypothetical protein